MKKLRKNGFVLLFVIVLIAVFGLEMFVLTGGSNTMRFQSDTAYLRAVEHNLAASGLAWARKNAHRGNKEILGQVVKLDVSNIDIRDAALSVMAGSPSDEGIKVEINSTCGRGRRTVNCSNVYKVEW